MFQKVGDKTHLYNKVVQQLKMAVLQGDFKRGDKLPTEKELGQIFMVSRTIIREAVKSLEATGLIEVKHGYGIFVSQRSPISYTIQTRSKKETVIQIVEVRKVLETKIAFWAANRAYEEKIKQAVQIISLTDQCIKNGNKGIAKKFEEYNKKFHLVLAEATGNKSLVLILDNLLRLMAGIQVEFGSIPGCITGSFEDHKKILMAVLHKDPEKASKEMYNHLLNIEKNIGVF